MGKRSTGGVYSRSQINRWVGVLYILCIVYIVYSVYCVLCILCIIVPQCIYIESDQQIGQFIVVATHCTVSFVMLVLHVSLCR